MNKQKSKKVYCAGGYVVYKNKLLLINNKTHDFIGIPKGHIEPGETKLLAARREIAEETGYDELELIKELETEKYVYQLPNQIPIQKTIYLFLFRLKRNKQNKLKLDHNENVCPFWADLQTVNDVVTYKENKEVIQKIKNLLL